MANSLIGGTGGITRKLNRKVLGDFTTNQFQGPKVATFDVTDIPGYRYLTVDNFALSYASVNGKDSYTKFVYSIEYSPDQGIVTVTNTVTTDADGGYHHFSGTVTCVCYYLSGGKDVTGTGSYVAWISRSGSGTETYTGREINANSFTISTNAITCTKAGRYHIRAMMKWSYLARPKITVNGTEVFAATGESSNSPTTYDGNFDLDSGNVIQFTTPGNDSTSECIMVIESI